MGDAVVSANPADILTLNVGIIGCGLIGRRRAAVAHESTGEKVAAVVDIDLAAAQEVAGLYDSRAYSDWREAVADENIDIIVVATPNKYLMPISVAALESGKHVLCEKPPGRNAQETADMVEAARRNNRLLKIGFNHRYHPAIWKAHELLNEGAIGPLMFGRAVYGHGGRPGYDQEWRGSADLAGGGEMLDQGVHIIDLLRWYMGEFSDIFAFSGTYFWNLGQFDSGQRMEDNAFMLLRTAGGQVAQLHTSWTQWKNRFSLEIFGKDGFLRLEGLGGSYGQESLTYGRRRPESGPPILEEFVFSGPDNSWQLEWQDFTNAIRMGSQPLSDGADGLKTMRVIAAFYESSASGAMVSL